MTETMTVQCPSCEREMGYTEGTHTWRCLACNPIPMDAPLCKTQMCKRPLTKLGPPWNCWICLNCNEHPDVVNKRKNETEMPDRKYVDVPMTEKRVREIAGKAMTAQDVRDIVRDTMAEFSTKDEDDPDYPPTQAEIHQYPEVKASEIDPAAQLEAQKARKPETWLQKAKRLGVQTHRDTGGLRKKVDIMADIAKVEGETDGGSSNVEN